MKFDPVRLFEVVQYRDGEYLRVKLSPCDALIAHVASRILQAESEGRLDSENKDEVWAEVAAAIVEFAYDTAAKN